MCPTIPAPKPFDPTRALMGLARDYLRNVYGQAPDQTCVIAANVMLQADGPRARTLGHWLAGQGNGAAAAMYMVRLKAWGAAHTLGAMPKAGQLGPVVGALRAYQAIVEKAAQV